MGMRRHIFIGDLQGCWDAFQRLLDRLRFDPAADRLCLAGDLVNRGGKSLKVLRQLRRLGDPHFSVLGNHDLHLLAYWQNHPRVRKKNPEFEKILNHADGPAVLEWLRGQPLLWTDETLRIGLVHAGIDPRWDRARAEACARELETVIRGPKFGRFIDHMYGNRPVRWKPDQKRYVRARTLTNVFTRMRFARSDGKLELESSGDLKRRPKGYQPWFELIHPDWSDWTVVFGHWSMLGHYENGQVMCLDSGCVWGGCLTAWVVDGDNRTIVQSNCR
jgi:bis(5'-nucleosyl)-tetraphosphatase (symmetrical)